MEIGRYIKTPEIDAIIQNVSEKRDISSLKTDLIHVKTFMLMYMVQIQVNMKIFAI